MAEPIAIIEDKTPHPISPNGEKNDSYTIVNGIKQLIPYQVCQRCIQDTSIPGIKFDNEGVCNFCHMHDKLERMFPNDHRGEKILNNYFGKIQSKGKGNKWDCVIGISGGRDSTWTLWNAVKKWGLRPLAVHFNDGFDNPVAGENMVKAVEALGIELRTITSDWREAKQLKIDFLKASTPDLNLGTDIGIATALYGVASKENIQHIIIGQSFRTEGIKPLSWAFFDGDYLRAVHNKFCNVPLKKWEPNNPGFNLGTKELFYYSIIKGIQVFTPMYYSRYIRTEAEKIIKKDLDWTYPGAHYYDDLYHSLIKYVHRIKFNIDYNMNSDAALVRSGQMNRDKALERAHGIYQIEDAKVIELCIKRLGITHDEFEEFLKIPPKTFYDYPTSYPLMRALKWPIWILSRLHLIPKVAYDKYFNIGR